LSSSHKKCIYYKEAFINVLLVLALAACTNNKNNIALTNVVTSDSVVTLTEFGQIEAIHSASLSSPGNWRMDYRIRYLPPEGSYVNKGDTIVKFDTQEVKSKLDEAQAELDIQSAELAEVRYKSIQSIEELKSSYQRVLLEYETTELRFENARYESDITRKDLELQLEKVKLNMQRSVKELEAQEIINKKDENLILLKINQALGKLKQAKKMYDQMFLISPRSGIVVYKKTGRGAASGKIKIGDSVYPRTSIVSIPDLNAMKAVIQLNEVDRTHIRINQTAKVMIEAFPDTSFEGRVTDISRIVNSSRDMNQVKTYNVDVEIRSKENFRLKPGLSSKITIQTDTLSGVFRVPAYCLAAQGKNCWVVHNGSKIPVRLSMLRDGFAFVKGMLKSGMVLETIKPF